MIKRRKILIGLGATIAITGCTERTEDEVPETEPEPEPEPESEPEEDPEPSEAERDPEGVVEEYFRAVGEGDVETQQELLYEESNANPEPSELTIHEIEEVGVEEYAEFTGADERLDEEELEEITIGEDIIGGEASAYDDHSLVYFRSEEGDGIIALIYDGKWKILS